VQGWLIVVYEFAIMSEISKGVPPMAEVKIKCEYPESIKKLFQNAIDKEWQSLLDGIARTEARLKEFEAKYQVSTEEFLRRFENDEIQHRLDREFDEWIGESWMLKSLLEEWEHLKGLEIVN
jgi:hypothetical protein